MKRYLVFTGRQFYPGQGWEDFKTSFDHVENALGYVAGHDDYDWWQIVDSHTGKIIFPTP